MENEKIRQQIQSELPNIPEDVIDDWLIPAAKNNGWPPQNLYWQGVLLMHDLNFWKSTTWSEEVINLEKALWAYGTRDAITQMASGFSGNTYSLFGTQKEKDRVLAPIKHLLQTGEMPRKISLLAVGDGFEIADGHHRYLALIQARNVVNVIDKFRQAGRISELDEFFKTLETRWGVKEIASIPTEHKVWVARHVTD